jgi:lipopolysaccharide export system permease protein
MKLLDIYIIKKFLGTFVYAIALIISISIIFDISEKVDDFIEKQAPLKAIVFDYYLNFIPYFVNLFSPLFTFIAVIFFTSKMAFNTEIIAILTSGVSFRRLLLPYIISAAAIATMSYFLGNYIIPHSNARRINFEDTFVRNKYRISDLNIHKQIYPGEFIYVEDFNNLDMIGSKFALEHIQDGKLTLKMMAAVIRWDSLRSLWQVENYTIRKFNEDGEILTKGAKLDTAFNFKPSDFTSRLVNVETMNKPELDAFIAREKLKGSEEVPAFELEKYRRVSMPFATFVLTLIGVAMASRKVRGGIGLHIGIGLVISFSYILFMQISATFSTNGNLPALAAVWLPNAVYFIIALWLLRMAPK